MKVVLGVGNPEEKYAATRHNVGWMVVDALGERIGGRFRKAGFEFWAAQGRLGSETVALVKRHIGSIPAADRKPAQATAWDKVVKRQTVEWDATLRAVCLGFPPPHDRTETAALSLFGSLVAQRLMTDPHLKEIANMAICSHQQWKVGTLPFFAYAAAKDGQSLEDVEKTLKDQFFDAVCDLEEVFRV